MKSVKILNLVEAGRKAKRHPTTIRKAILLGLLPAHRVSDAPQSHWRVKLPDLEKFLKQYPPGVEISGEKPTVKAKAKAKPKPAMPPTNRNGRLPEMVALKVDKAVFAEAQAAAKLLSVKFETLVEAALSTYLEGLR